jgi:phosphate transport system substrate-binding protein
MSNAKQKGLIYKIGVAVTALALSAGLAAPANATDLRGNGSSAVKNLLDACIPDWSKWSSHNLAYPGGGSGAGRSGFLAGTVDLAFSDTPYSATESKPPAANFVYIPASVFPIAVFANLPGFTGPLNLSPSTVADIYAGKITKWNDPAIVADNTVVNAKTKKKTVAKLPTTAITVYYRFDRSGTSEIFTDWLSKQAPTVWTKPKSGTFT